MKPGGAHEHKEVCAEPNSELKHGFQKSGAQNSELRTHHVGEAHHEAGAHQRKDVRPELPRAPACFPWRPATAAQRGRMSRGGPAAIGDVVGRICVLCC